MLENLFEASFKGITFLEIEDETETGGIKHIVHEYPLSDRRNVEFLGVQLPEFSIICQFHGDNLRNNRDRFRQAITDGVSGILVTQFKGKQNVKAVSYTLLESTSTIGVATFTVQFVAESQNTTIAPESIGATSLAVEEQELNLVDQAIADFSEAIASPSTSTEYQAMTDTVNDFLDVVDTITSNVDSVTSAVNDVNNQIASIQSTITDLIKSPLNLAGEISATISMLETLTDNPSTQLDQLSNFLDF